MAILLASVLIAGAACAGGVPARVTPIRAMDACGRVSVE